MKTTASILESLNLPVRDAYDLPASFKRFADGGQYRIEIPSCEGPRAMETVLAAAREYAVPVHRVSQGSGVMLQTDDEIARMVALGREHAIEVCLFVGPRASWDVGVQAASTNGRVLGASLRLAWVNGQPGAVTYDAEGRVVNVFELGIAGGVVQAIRSVVNPDKLGHLGPVSDVARLPGKE